MEEFEIIDSHLHTYRTAEQGWLGRSIGDSWDPGGTIDELLRYMDEAGVSKAIMGNLAPTVAMRLTARQRMPKNLSESQRKQAEERIEKVLKQRLERQNLWGCSVAKSNPRLIASIAIEPSFGSAWMVEEIEDKVKNHGAKCIKLHPGQQWFYPNDHVMWPAYKKAEELGVPIQSHTGDADALWVKYADCSYPKYFADMLAAFPKLSLVLIHFMHYTSEGRLEQALDLAQRFPNVYFDISHSCEIGVLESEVELMRRVGIDRITRGSDWHSRRPTCTIESIKQTPLLTNEEKHKILGKNAKRLYKL